MGQAWCKEKSCKAQDSKSPLDRVFVRCAHTIYPSLKEEGSVLGGGGGVTQRVTSSEIGYSSSPPALLRGTSIDSVDRPFHPSDWVDVNLEVPCEPRASVTRYNSYTTAYNAYQQRDNSAWPLANGSKSPKTDVSSLTPMMVGGAPVPPPRRRRRRHQQDRSTSSGVMSTSGGASTTGGACSSGGDRTEDDDDDEVDPNYAKLLFKSSTSAANKPKDDAATGSKNDSDDEFVKIERSLELADRATKPPETTNEQQQKRARPKNHSTTSLPNVAELLVGGDSQAAASSRAEEVVRPPRHVKANSLPRDALMCAPQTPERLFFPTRKIEEDRSTDDDKNDDDGDVNTKKDDNSIFKIEDGDVVGTAAAADAGEVSPDSSLRFEADVKTSTPVKDNDATAAAAEVSTSSASRNLEDDFLSFGDRSTSSNSSSQRNPEGEQENSSLFVAPHEVDRPASVAGIRSDDAGYESKSSSHLFSDGSSGDAAAVAAAIGDEYQELSSGILTDAIIDSTDESSLQQDEADNPIVLEIQRTLSEESLPREMLIEEINDDDDDEEEQQANEDDEKSAKDTSNRRTRDAAEESFKTPPPSPAAEIKGRESPSSSTVDIVDITEEEEEEKLASNHVEAKKAMTPSLMELEVALTDMLEKKDEEERERADEHRRSKDDEEKIVAVTKRETSVEEVKEVENGEDSSKNRMIEFNRSVRINPFDDYNIEDIVFNNSSLDEPPEKPNRLHRISLIEESIIDEPLIVPTPPRRKHRSSRSSSGNNTSAEPVVHTYAINDRLI